VSDGVVVCCGVLVDRVKGGWRWYLCFSIVKLRCHLDLLDFVNLPYMHDHSWRDGGLEVMGPGPNFDLSCMTS
jgi:hypothetical protein